MRAWPDFDGHSDQELRYTLGRATPFPGFERGSISPHRAALDVVVTAAILEELIKKAANERVVLNALPYCAGLLKVQLQNGRSSRSFR